MATIPFVDLQAQYRRIKASVDARIHKVLDHGRFILGPEVAELETALAAFSGAKKCVAVSSGTEALRIPLMAEGIGPGDAVFMPSFTFTATAEVAVAVGAQPVMVDVAENSFNIDPRSLEQAIAKVRKDGKLRPRAVIAVDLFGLPADYLKLGDICRAEGLFLLADAAQSYGAAVGNRRVGSLAPVTATSFFPAKPLGCYGDGGAIFTDDPDRAAAYLSIRAHGAGGDRYDIVRIGTNGRLDTMQAAVLLSKLEIFEDELKSRERAAAAYDRLLTPAIVKPPRRADAQSAWAQYVVILPESADRDAIMKALAADGVPTAIYYPLPMHMQTAYKGFGDGPGSLPVSERLSKRVLALPMHPYLDEATIERVASRVNSALGAK